MQELHFFPTEEESNPLALLATLFYLNIDVRLCLTLTYLLDLRHNSPPFLVLLVTLPTELSLCSLTEFSNVFHWWTILPALLFDFRLALLVASCLTVCDVKVVCCGNL